MNRSRFLSAWVSPSLSAHVPRIPAEVGGVEQRCPASYFGALPGPRMWLSLEESRMGLWGTRRLWRGSSPTRVHFTPNLSPQVLTGATNCHFDRSAAGKICG